MNEPFVDSNVYAFDKSDVRKQEIAFSILNQSPVFSSQAIIETYNACFRKLRLSARVCEAHILILTGITQLFKIDKKPFDNAFAMQRRFGFSFLDSLIVASALQAECPVLYSENMEHNLVVENTLTIVNPFLL